MKRLDPFLHFSRVGLVLSLGLVGVGCSDPQPHTKGGTGGNVEAGGGSSGGNVEAGGGSSGGNVEAGSGSSGGNVEAGVGGGNPPGKPKASCLDLYNVDNMLEDGVHTIHLNGTDLSVYCEMMKNSVQNEGGAGEPGWTLILATGKKGNIAAEVKGPKYLTELKDKGPTLENPGYLTVDLMKSLAASAQQIKIVSLGNTAHYVVSTEITDDIKGKAPLTFLREGKRLDTKFNTTTDMTQFWGGPGLQWMKIGLQLRKLDKYPNYPHLYWAGTYDWGKANQAHSLGLHLAGEHSLWKEGEDLDDNIPLGVYVR